MTKPSRNWRALFSDAARMRRDDSRMIVLKNTNYYQRRWAHEVGGNIITHQGNAFWLPNR